MPHALPLSSPRTRGSIVQMNTVGADGQWMPAFAGMTMACIRYFPMVFAIARIWSALWVPLK